MMNPDAKSRTNLIGSGLFCMGLCVLRTELLRYTFSNMTARSTRRAQSYTTQNVNNALT